MKRLSKCLLLILVTASLTSSWLPGNKTLLTETAAAVLQSPPQLTLSCEIPNDVTIPQSHVGNPTAEQQDFDTYSWNTFMALNWPAVTNSPGTPPCKLQNGVANCNMKIGQRGTEGIPTVWETFKGSYEIFQSDSSGNPVVPTGWNCLPTLPEGCGKLTGKSARNIKVINMISKDAVNEVNEAFSGPLVDQNGNYARYEIRVNYDEFKHIMDKKLYDSRNQVNVRFPAGANLPGGRQGAMEIKAAWKVMGRGDDPKRFHTRRTIIAWVDAKTGKYKCTKNPVLMGLVGLHIAHKTVHAPQWIWSTFEQVDNYVHLSGRLGQRASFSKPNCRRRPARRTSNPQSRGTPTRRSSIARRLRLCPRPGCVSHNPLWT